MDADVNAACTRIAGDLNTKLADAIASESTGDAKSPSVACGRSSSVEQGPGRERRGSCGNSCLQDAIKGKQDAALAGDGAAAFCVGQCYKDNIGGAATRDGFTIDGWIGTNRVEANYWYKLGADAGDADAQYALRIVYRKPEGWAALNPAAALAW